MKSIYKHMIGFTLLVIIASVFHQWIPNRNSEEKIKIAISDDISGVLLNYMVREKGLQEAVIEKGFETHPIKDCCSNTTHWALTSGALDIAIICPSAAEVLINEDDGFKIIGPVILNSDIFVVKEGVAPKKIGVTQNRHYQETLAKEKFGKDIEILPMLPTTLPYALERDIVDGIVIDVLRGLTLQGQKSTTAFDKDYPSYVLVIRKDFQGEKSFVVFMEALREAINELQDNDILLNEIIEQQYVGFTEKEVKMWPLMKLKFIHPEKKL